ncbi:hypothetical protein K490DRAFT_67828 [Saccharata proteae CBS 121410]|uniref:Rhodopsin domain-containing protein n=1 Tax=Saccharata proteae CBS 121410 TaxID=1314787 RepID=A0A9P4LUY4_9PEZI|nr:hypothetical protein K490DRAFT_67828 [Saccharata proteae CBS 121410]
MARETINLGLPYGLALPLSLLANVMIWMRFYVRVRIMKVKPFLEDWLAFVSCMIFSALSLAASVEIENGMGLHIKELEDRPDEIIQLAKFEWAGEWITLVVTSLTKLSILLLYRRVFAIKRPILLITNALIIFIPLYNIPIVGSIIFSCSPVSFYWTRYLPQTPTSDPQAAGTCTISIVLLYYLITIFNVITDFAILALPILALRHTRIQRRKRLALTVLFALGSSPGLVAIARFAIAHHLASEDFSYWMWPESVVLELECWLGLICVCLPSLVPLLMVWWPGVWEDGTEGRDSGPDDHIGIRDSVIARVFRSLSLSRGRSNKVIKSGAARSRVSRISMLAPARSRALGESDWAELRSMSSRTEIGGVSDREVDLEAAMGRRRDNGDGAAGDDAREAIEMVIEDLVRAPVLSKKPKMEVLECEIGSVEQAEGEQNTTTGESSSKPAR